MAVLGELSLGAEVVASGAVSLAVWQEEEEVVLSTWLWDQAGNTTCCTTGIKVPITHPHTTVDNLKHADPPLANRRSTYHTGHTASAY